VVVKDLVVVVAVAVAVVVLPETAIVQIDEKKVWMEKEYHRRNKKK
jgi:hypothetical protein